MSLIHAVSAFGYALLGLFYAVSGLLHFRHFGELAAGLSARRVPMPKTVLATGSVFQTVAGSMLAAQAQLRYSAFGLAVFTLLASLMFLDFWRQSGPARQAGIRAWQTNLGLVGALLAIGAG